MGSAIAHVARPTNLPCGERAEPRFSRSAGFDHCQLLSTLVYNVALAVGGHVLIGLTSPLAIKMH